MLSIVVAVGLAVCTIFTGYMGVHVTLHPPSEGQKKWWTAGFVVVGLAAIVLIGFQAKMGNDAENRTQAALPAFQA
jgi:O-antigen ligase